MAKKIVTLYIDDTSIRLVTTDGKSVTQWGRSSLEPGLVKGGVIADEEKVAAAIRELADEKKISLRKVIVGFSGLHSLTLLISLPQLSETVLAEAVMREAARVLPIPLDQLYITWETIQTPDKRTRAFAIGVPRDTMDALMRTLQRAGIRPHHMDIKPLALIRLLGGSTAVFVDVQPNEFDVVIFTDGIPQPIRTIPLPDRELSPEEKLSMVRDDVARTMEFYDSKNPEAPLASDVPIYVSGELALDPEMSATLSEELEHPVKPLSIPLKHPSGFSPSNFAVNVGLAAREFSGKTKPASLVSQLDTLPAAFRPSTFSLGRVGALTGISLLAVLILWQGALVQMNFTAMSSARNRLANTGELVELERAEGRDVRTELNQAEASRDMLNRVVGTLAGRRNSFDATLFTATDTMPETVSLRSVGSDGSLLEVVVESLDELEVLGYARTLRASGQFSDVLMVRARRKVPPALTFNLTLIAKEN